MTTEEYPGQWLREIVGLDSEHKPEPSLEQYREAWRLLDLVVAEWNSDPMSVQCFDLHIVRQAQNLMKAPRL